MAGFAHILLRYFAIFIPSSSLAAHPIHSTASFQTYFEVVVCGTKEKTNTKVARWLVRIHNVAFYCRQLTQLAQVSVLKPCAIATALQITAVRHFVNSKVFLSQKC